MNAPSRSSKGTWLRGCILGNIYASLKERYQDPETSAGEELRRSKTIIVDDSLSYSSSPMALAVIEAMDKHWSLVWPCIVILAQ
ncbi:hypothetical protein PM082_021342 [Marasmius tenuissimus]|nr:hypothetical protein PM082_021342 [Marasmius tenuissimus]